jgi:hypothetical protein
MFAIDWSFEFLYHEHALCRIIRHEMNDADCKPAISLAALSNEIVESSLASVLESFEQLLRRILTIALRVIADPFPQVGASILKSEFRLPVQLLICTGWVGCQIKHIACTSSNNFILELMADNFAERIDHLKDSAATSRPQIPSSNARLLLSEVVKSSEMTFGEIDHVDIIADGCAVSGFVVLLLLACD